MTLRNEFEKNNIIKTLTHYEIFYQITLGKLFTIPSCKKININLDFTLALGSIFETINDIKDLDNAKDIFVSEIQKQAAMDALQGFANENLEAIKNKSLSIDDIVNKINDNEFFNETMNNLANENFGLKRMAI